MLESAASTAVVRQLRALLRYWRVGPTPKTALEHADGLSRLHGVDLFLKREDRIDDLGSGHKLRKLNYLHRAVALQGADVLLTAGSLPSGQCVAVAAAAREWGLRSRLVYLGDLQHRPAYASGHYLRATLLADRTDWFERTPWDQACPILERLAEEERRAGANPFVVEPGIPAWPAPLGSVELGLQLYQQLQHQGTGTKQTHVLALAGTGGTCVGLGVASMILGADWAVHGICMGVASSAWRHRLGAAAADCVGRIGLVAQGPLDLRLHSFAWSGAYGDPSSFEREAILRYLREQRLALDPNYMIKVFLGYEALVASSLIGSGDRVVIVYSGGSVDFLSGSPLATEWLLKQVD